MGLRVGLDFGTTTSILSFLEGAEPRPFHYGGQAHGVSYVPSVVAYLPNDLLIGRDAIEMTPTSARLFRYFKMLLPEENSERWNSEYGPYGGDITSPNQVASDFIGELVRGSSPGRERLKPKKPNGASFYFLQQKEIERLVVSVPEVWNDIGAYGRHQLQTIVQDSLGVPIQLISEPVAAAAYFSYRYQQTQQNAFVGNLLVCDMGGGTFDVTLCKLSKERVDVLCNAGNGERGLGVAGVRFDIDLLKPKIDGNRPEVLAELLLALDEKKKSKASAGRLERYHLINSQERVEPIYSLPSSYGAAVTISYKEIEEAFMPVREGIFQVLGEVKRKAGELAQTIDRVVLVGGFSQFLFVQLAVGDFFNEDILDNPRLIDLDTLNRDHMAFAISYGACLVANEKVQITERYEHTISINAYMKPNKAWTEVQLINGGNSLDVLNQTTFCMGAGGIRQHFQITDDAVDVEILIRLSGKQDDKLTQKLSLTNVPNRDIPNNLWYLGARVDKSKIPYLILEDVTKRERKEYPLGDLIPSIIIRD